MYIIQLVNTEAMFPLSKADRSETGATVRGKTERHCSIKAKVPNGSICYACYMLDLR